MTVSQIRLKLHAKRLSEVQATLARAQAKLAGSPGFWDAARQFQRDLLQAVSNRVVTDDRPPGVRGVTPADATKPFQGVNVLSPDHTILRQRVPDATRLYVNCLRPVSDEERAFYGAR